MLGAPRPTRRIPYRAGSVAIVLILERSTPRSNAASIVSAPWWSNTTVTAVGAAARTLPASPGPYSTGITPSEAR